MSGVKAGIMLSNQQFEGADMVSALEDQLAMVRLARDRGWDSYFCGQHYLNEGGNQGLQMVPYLARLAADAGDMTMGVGLLLAPLHNPVYTAETIATLDVISKGNMVFGVGLGYRTAEFEAFGVRWTITDDGDGYPNDKIYVNDGFRTVGPTKLYAGNLWIGPPQ